MTPDRKCYLYRVSLKEDPSKDYIGISYDYKRRWIDHKAKAKNGKDVFFFHRALKKYGQSAFDWKVLGIYRNRKIAAEMEKISIKFLGMGHYNLTEGGDGSVTMSDETKVKLSLSVKRSMTQASKDQRSLTHKKTIEENPDHLKRLQGQLASFNQDPEIRQRRALSTKLATGTVEARKRRSDICKKVLNTPEAKRNMSNGQKRRLSTPEARAQRSKQLSDYFSSPEGKIEFSGRMKEMTNRPEVKAKVSATSKARWQEAKSLGFTTLKQLAEYKAKLNPQ